MICCVKLHHIQAYECIRPVLLTSEGDLVNSVEVVCADVEPRRHPTALIPSRLSCEDNESETLGL